MSDDDGEFDLDKYRLDPNTIPQAPPGQNTSKRVRRGGVRCFAPVPCFWLSQLHKAKFRDTLKLALHLMQARFIHKSDVIPLSTVAVKPWHIDLRSKNRALAELERLGLIRIEHQPPKVPIVHLQHLEGLPRHL